jgi:hypothetical protein
MQVEVEEEEVFKVLVQQDQEDPVGEETDLLTLQDQVPL